LRKKTGKKIKMMKRMKETKNGETRQKTRIDIFKVFWFNPF